MNIENTLNNAEKALHRSNIKTSILDSEILLAKAINKDRKYIILNLKQNLEEKYLNIYNNLIEKRKKGQPVAYLTEKKEFWKNTFYVNKHVLIPRPDTEIIIEEAFKLFLNKKSMHILDIGTGSGCILLSLLKEFKDFYGTGIDISKECIKVSKYNSKLLKLDNRVKFFISDVDNFIIGKYDVIISNPPYIEKYKLKYLEKGIVNYEPNLALDGGIDGFFEINKVISNSRKLLKKNGKFFLEIGFNQRQQVKKILEKKGFFINKILRDYGKNYRCVICTKI